MSGIYIHIPFCRQACHYCNFHFSTSLKYEDDMMEAIGKELLMRKNYLANEAIETVYLGGGTPSIISNKNLKSLFQSINLHYDINSTLEVTIEANPEDITIEKLNLWEQLGITRVSLGVQSLFDEDLKWMNRIHTTKQSHAALEMCATSGLDFSVDLIFGNPFTTNEIWKQNLEKCIGYNPEHFSCYALTVEKGTALHSKIEKGTSKGTDEQKINEQFYIAKSILTANEYVHYEISNYCKPQKQAIHNTNYWRSKPYLGIGPAAHSFYGNNRQWNISNNAKYIQGVTSGKRAFEEERLTVVEVYNEYIMTRLRTNSGCSLNEINKKFHAHFQLSVEKQINRGNIDLVNERYVLTEKALIISDSIASDLFMV